MCGEVMTVIFLRYMTEDYEDYQDYQPIKPVEKQLLIIVSISKIERLWSIINHSFYLVENYLKMKSEQLNPKDYPLLNHVLKVLTMTLVICSLVAALILPHVL